MSLKAAELRKLQPSDTPYRKSDGKGLYLEIYPNGSKLWRFKYRMNGKEKRFSLGAWPEVTLANARKKRDEFRLVVLDGRDPSLERKKRKRLARINASNSFASVAEDFLTVRMVNNGRSERTVKKARWCISHLLPTIGNRPIAEIEPAEILEVLKKIERRGHRETAHRTRSVASRIFSPWRRLSALYDRSCCFVGRCAVHTNS